VADHRKVMGGNLRDRLRFLVLPQEKQETVVLQWYLSGISLVLPPADREPHQATALRLAITGSQPVAYHRKPWSALVGTAIQQVVRSP